MKDLINVPTLFAKSTNGILPACPGELILWQVLSANNITLVKTAEWDFWSAQEERNPTTKSGAEFFRLHWRTHVNGTKP